MDDGDTATAGQRVSERVSEGRSRATTMTTTDLVKDTARVCG